MSLRQDILKSKLQNNRGREQERDTGGDSDDELVGVVSAPGTPGGTRPSSPTRASGRSARGPLYLSSSTSTKSKTDPLRAFPTEVSQGIFNRLSIRDLAKCSLVCKKWNKSQTLNYVWFQLYRKENFHDESLPPGKWTKRESKQNWRVVYGKTLKEREPPVLSRQSRRESRMASRQHSPTRAQIKEDMWEQEDVAAERPDKVEMREMYKELGGRKAKEKTKLGRQGGVRDKGGWADLEDYN